MKLYIIRDWNVHYENNRSRELKELSWVIVPNRHDGEHYSQIVAHPDGAKIFAAWNLIIQVASRTHLRGHLLRGNNTPHTPVSLSAKTRAPAEWFSIAFDYLEKNTDWLIVEQFTLEKQDDLLVIPQVSAAQSRSALRDGDEEGKGKKGREGKGIEPKELKARGSVEEVKEFCKSESLPESDAIWFFHKNEGNGWTNGGKPIKDWKATIRSWKAGQYLPSQKPGQQGFHKPQNFEHRQTGNF